MVRKIIFLSALIFPLLTDAQTVSIGGSWANEPAKLSKNIAVDTSVMECIYHYRIIDHDAGDMREYHAILEMGDSISKYESYGSYRLDSALAVKQQITNGEFMKLHSMYNPDFKDVVLENANSNQLDYYGKVSIDSYTYKEEIPKINWVLSDSTKDICGYSCHQATATFRGRKWHAWYCDIPKSVGPWKLNGLPGLILEAKTDDNEHAFTAISVRKSSSPITFTDKEYFKTTREYFNKALADYKSAPGRYWKNTPLAGKDENGKPLKMPKRKLFHNPLEKE